MKLMLKTLGVSLVLAIAGCANTGTNTASLSAADDTPACAASCSSSCKAACDANKAKTKTKCAADCTKACCADKASLGSMDDAPVKTKASCCPSSGNGSGCPFSGKKN